MKGKIFKVGIKGIGVYLPEKIIKNKDISKNVDTTEEWIYNKLGIKERRVAGINQKTSDLGYEAAIKALKNSNLDIEDIDLIIVSTSSPEKISPSISCTINEKLKIKKNIPSFDINAVCSGFVYGLTIGASMIESGAYENILIITTETYSKNTNWNDKHSVFFGDGAGAIVLGKSKEGWLYSEIEANGEGTGMTGFVQPLDSPFIMKGKEVWDQAIKVLPNSIKNVLRNTKTDINEISMLVPHQPSINILKIIANDIGLPIEKVKTVMDLYGNIASSSIPIALNDCLEKKEIKDGDKILFSAIGSGWTWGTILMYYKNN
jgi:3-oxoacyl-[acyl-carrier-protein] synthase-3